MSEWPKHFRGTYDNTIYLLTYVHGSTDHVVGVRVREASDERGRPVIEVEYPYGHGSGLRIGRIDHEDADSITFQVEEPQTPSLDGVATLRRT